MLRWKEAASSSHDEVILVKRFSQTKFRTIKMTGLVDDDLDVFLISSETMIMNFE